MATRRPSAANGRDGDDVLLHVNKSEAADIVPILRNMGGLGSRNPFDGLLEFRGGQGGDSGGGGSAGNGGGGSGGGAGGGAGGHGNGASGTGGQGGDSGVAGGGNKTSTGGTISHSAGAPGPSDHTGSTGPGSTSVGDPRGNEGLGGVNGPGMGPGTSGVGASANSASPTGGSWGGTGQNANPSQNGGFPGAAEFDLGGFLAGLTDKSPNTMDPTFNVAMETMMTAVPAIGYGLGLTNALHAAGLNSTATDTSGMGKQSSRPGKDIPPGAYTQNAEDPTASPVPDYSGTSTSESSGGDVGVPSVSGVADTSDAARRRRGGGLGTLGLAI